MCAALGDVTAPQMRSIVLDYLIHRAHVGTALAFARENSAGGATQGAESHTFGIPTPLYDSCVARHRA